MGAFTRDPKTIGPDIERVFTLFPRLRERTHQQGGTLSGGEQQMLAIGRALMSEPAPPPARRAVARPRADPRPADLRDDQGDQRAGHDDPARRAERAAGADDRQPRLRAPDRPRRPVGHGRRAAPERDGPEGLPRRGLSQGHAPAGLRALQDRLAHPQRRSAVVEAAGGGQALRGSRARTRPAPPCSPGRRWPA